MLPSFVIVGAQKAATTSLWQYLGRHPAVFVTPVKETDFFVAQRAWPRGLAWYESLFAGAGDGVTAVGEASPNYTMFPGFGGVPERMARIIPSAKLIYLLRQPVERMRAGYIHALAMGQEARPIEQALLDRPQYADTSRYAMQIEQYLRHFDRSQLLILLAEDLERRPGETFDRVLSFLGLPAGWRPPDLGVRHHPTLVKRIPRPWARRLGGFLIRARVPEFRVPARARIQRSRLTTRPLTPGDTTLPDDVRRRLEDLLRPDVERLRQYLGPDFDGWGLLS
jgi:hypothetical protein